MELNDVKSVRTIFGGGRSESVLPPPTMISWELVWCGERVMSYGCGAPPEDDLDS